MPAKSVGILILKSKEHSSHIINNTPHLQKEKNRKSFKMRNVKIRIYIFVIIICLSSCIQLLHAQNLALKLDGEDNNVRTGIGFIEAPWTLETWIKGDDSKWKKQEVLFGGGEYSTYSQADNLPLVISEGRLCSVKAGLISETVLDEQWHHVALTCDGEQMRLYIDGKLNARKDTAVIIIPGAIGVNETSESVFGGMMDEVRVWKAALTEKTIGQWKGRPLSPKHKAITELIAYYNFDAGIDDTALNWMGSGYLSYHLRNGRIGYSGSKPVAHAVSANNEGFTPYEGKQRIFSVVPIESEWDVVCGSKENQMMKMRICTQGKRKPISVKGFTLNLQQMSNPKNVSSVSVYYTGQTARSKQRELLYRTDRLPEHGKVKIDLPPSLQKELKEGANYLLVTAYISTDAVPNDTVRVVLEELILGKRKYSPVPHRPYYIPILVTKSSVTDANVFSVLQWNIWHGGRHVPIEGKERIIELIRSSGADIVTMQEGYGLQEYIASALNFHLQTQSAKDNLALFSRYPLEKLPTHHSFRSNPAMVTLPNGKELLVDDCWLRYSYRPDYTGSYPDVLHDTDGWVREDSVVPMADARSMIEKDIEPVLKQRDVPVIIGGTLIRTAI